jgi:hypothetical protein
MGSLARVQSVWAEMHRNLDGSDCARAHREAAAGRGAAAAGRPMCGAHYTIIIANAAHYTE